MPTNDRHRLVDDASISASVATAALAPKATALVARGPTFRPGRSEDRFEDRGEEVTHSRDGISRATSSWAGAYVRDDESIVGANARRTAP